METYRNNFSAISSSIPCIQIEYLRKYLRKKIKFCYEIGNYQKKKN